MLAMVGCLSAGGNTTSGVWTKAVVAVEMARGKRVGVGVGLKMEMNSLIRGHMGKMMTKANARIPSPANNLRTTLPMIVSGPHLILKYQKKTPTTESNSP